MTNVQRIVLDFRSGELVARVLYRASLDGPNAGTKARRREEVTELARQGLTEALSSLSEGDVQMVGVSGFTTREDLLCITTPTTPAAVHKELKRGA